MTSLYNRAANEFPAMRQAARQRRARLAGEAAGVQSLWGDAVADAAAPVSGTERLYEYFAPRVPYGATET